MGSRLHDGKYQVEEAVEFYVQLLYILNLWS